MLIDEKGKIFGKINIIDLGVIIFILSLVPMIYFGYKIFIKQPVVLDQEKEFIEIEMNFRFKI